MENWKEGKGTSGCALIIACLLVRCGSSVYVQKKSCSLTSSSGKLVSGGGAVADSGLAFNRAAALDLISLEVVTVEVETAILELVCLVLNGCAINDRETFKTRSILRAIS